MLPVYHGSVDDCTSNTPASGGEVDGGGGSSVVFDDAIEIINVCLVVSESELSGLESKVRSW